MTGRDGARQGRERQGRTGQGKTEKSRTEQGRTGLERGECQQELHRAIAEQVMSAHNRTWDDIRQGGTGQEWDVTEVWLTPTKPISRSAPASYRLTPHTPSHGWQTQPLMLL